MASLTFSAAVMTDIRTAMRQHRHINKQSPPVAHLPVTTIQHDHHEAFDEQDVVMDEPDVGETGAMPCIHDDNNAQRVFDAWVQDLDDQSLPDMDKDELRILHALLFGAGDDAFAVADDLLNQTLAA